MIVVIIGPTGVGKTKLSLELAKKYNAEIINADAMQVYKEMNIGTAKVTDTMGINHHLLSIRSVNDPYSVYEYQKDGRELIERLKKENKNIIIVGGTGLYIKALLYDYKFNINDKNKDYYDLIYDDVYFIGLTTNRDNLYKRINDRVDEMIDEGLISEVKDLYDKNINTIPINTAIGYKELYKYFNNEISLEDAIELIKRNSRRYAKRQYTWINNKMNVKWFYVDFNNFNNTIKEVEKYITN